MIKKEKGLLQALFFSVSQNASILIDPIIPNAERDRSNDETKQRAQHQEADGLAIGFVIKGIQNYKTDSTADSPGDHDLHPVSENADSQFIVLLHNNILLYIICICFDRFDLCHCGVTYFYLITKIIYKYHSQLLRIIEKSKN